MLEKIISRLKKIVRENQQASEAKKKKIAIIVSGILIIFAMMIWGSYFQNILPQKEKNNDETPGSWQTFKRGVLIIFDDFLNQSKKINNQVEESVGKLKDSLNKENKIIINNEEIINESDATSSNQ